MLIKKYNEIMQETEEHRNKWALGLSLALTTFIFVGFAFYKGFVEFGNNPTMAKNEPYQTPNVLSVDLVPSPLQNSKQTLLAGFDEILKQYNLFKESLAAVLVPFVTGIDVYERK